MTPEERKAYREVFGPAKMRGRDARGMWTPGRWLRHKLTGSPLTACEQEQVKLSLYPNMQTSHQCSRIGPTNINLVSLQEKYNE